MSFQQTTRIMEILRERNQAVRRNNQRIGPCVAAYLDSCLMQCQPVTLLTQWCLSKGLEKRYEQVGGNFIPTKKEQLLFQTDLPNLHASFEKCGFRLNWYITFNRGFADSRRLDRGLEEQYKGMIEHLAKPLVEQGWLLLMDWESDILGGSRPAANPEVLAGPEAFVSASALARELKWSRIWLAAETNLVQSEEELRADVLYQIACEAEEGRFLTSAECPFGQDFILVPLEVPEQYDFFSIFVPGFKERIVAVLPPYPWRLRDIS